MAAPSTTVPAGINCRLKVIVGGGDGGAVPTVIIMFPKESTVSVIGGLKLTEDIMDNGDFTWAT